MTAIQRRCRDAAYAEGKVIRFGGTDLWSAGRERFRTRTVRCVARLGWLRQQGCNPNVLRFIPQCFAIAIVLAIAAPCRAASRPAVVRPPAVQVDPPHRMLGAETFWANFWGWFLNMRGRGIIWR